LPDRSWLAGFDSGEVEIDRNIDRCCERHVAYRSRTFCAVIEGQSEACGFYTFGVSAHDSKYLDEDIVRASDGRPFVPFVYLNYLAVRKPWQNQKIGTLLLGHALTRCGQVVREVGGIYGVALHALTHRAAGLYDRYGFREYGGRSQFPFMILPAKSLIDLTAG
jgi:GNAT superfamily N-acetyltransferase